LYIFSQFASGPQLLISQQSGPQRKKFGDPWSGLYIQLHIFRVIKQTKPGWQCDVLIRTLTSLWRMEVLRMQRYQFFVYPKLYRNPHLIMFSLALYHKSSQPFYDLVPLGHPVLSKRTTSSRTANLI